MPPKDDIMAPGIFNEGTPGPRFFDFSSAPDVNDFNASTCPASLEWFGRDSLYLTGCEASTSREAKGWGLFLSPDSSGGLLVDCLI